MKRLTSLRLSRASALTGLLCSAALVALAAMATTAARAQEPMPVEPPPGSRYEVEILIFRNLDPGASTELPRPTPTSASADGDGTTSFAPPLQPVRPVEPATSGWPALDAGSLRLGGVAARLRRGGAYQLLYHGGWVQDVTSQARALPTPLPLEAVRAGAGGTVTLYRERYLHALVDAGLASADGGREELRWIKQGRRLRGSAVQYFDNPAVGLMLTVRPTVAAAAPAATAAP